MWSSERSVRGPRAISKEWLPWIGQLICGVSAKCRGRSGTNVPDNTKLRRVGEIPASTKLRRVGEVPAG
jgi:hypothetical protein